MNCIFLSHFENCWRLWCGDQIWTSNIFLCGNKGLKFLVTFRTSIYGSYRGNCPQFSPSCWFVLLFCLRLHNVASGSNLFQLRKKTINPKLVVRNCGPKSNFLKVLWCHIGNKGTRINFLAKFQSRIGLSNDIDSQVLRMFRKKIQLFHFLWFNWLEKDVFISIIWLNRSHELLWTF